MDTKYTRHMEKEIENMVYALWSLRKGNEMTQKEVAERMGITYNYLCAIERGKKIPSVEFLNDWAKVFNMRIHLRIGA